ncbi:MAG: RNA polymerase sigma factor SigZ [Myxococcota bacterium]
MKPEQAIPNIVNFEEVWRSYQSGLRAFLQSRVSNPSDVDDLHQDILLKTYANLHTVKSHASIKSWMMQIANRSIIDHYRKNRRRDEDAAADAAPLNEEDDESTHVLARCVEPFISALPEENANLLRAIDLQGHSQRAYAKELGVNYSTLKSRVQKAREELRGIVKNCCHLSLDGRGRVIDFSSKSDDCKVCP